MPALSAMVLCAGLGTRLRPLTDRVPKPVVPLCGAPLVAWALALLRGAGVRQVVVNTHHLPREMASAAGAAARRLGLSLAVSHEPIIAGTGGALREARSLLAGAEPLVIVNGDVLFDVDLPAAIAAHQASGALATMVLLPMPAGASYAAVEVDAGGAVRRIAGKFGPGGDGLTPRHFSGVHVLSPELLAQVPAAPFELDVREVYAALMASGRIRGHLADGYWNDLGTPARFLEAQGDLLAGRVPLARFRGVEPLSAAAELRPGVRAEPGVLVAAGATVHAPCFLGAGARIEAGAEVGPEVSIGAGEVVPAGAVVRRAAIWTGAALAAGERVEGAIAAEQARVRAE
jgi:mannose-1-phosphate guanylyltransferase